MTFSGWHSRPPDMRNHPFAGTCRQRLGLCRARAIAALLFAWLKTRLTNSKKKARCGLVALPWHGDPLVKWWRQSVCHAPGALGATAIGDRRSTPPPCATAISLPIRKKRKPSSCAMYKGSCHAVREGKGKRTRPGRSRAFRTSPSAPLVSLREGAKPLACLFLPLPAPLCALGGPKALLRALAPLRAAKPFRRPPPFGRGARRETPPRNGFVAPAG